MTIKSMPVKNIFSLFVGLMGFAATAHADGLPGEYVVSQQWRALSAQYSPITNPALLTETNYITPRAAFASMLQNSFQLWELGVTVPIDLNQSAGITFLSEGSDTLGEVNDGKATGQELRYQNDLVALSYAINPWNGLSIGGNLNIVNQNAFGTNSYGFGFDMGISYRLLRNPLFGNHTIGIAVQNLLAPILDSAAHDTSAYSRNLRFSWYSNYWEKQIEADFDFCLKDFMADVGNFQLKDSSGKVLSSFPQKIEWEFSGKIGYLFLQTLRITALFDINERGFNQWGLAFGINVPSVNKGRDMSGQYQYSSPPIGEQISSYTVYLMGEFYKHREELYAMRMSQSADVAPNQIYQKALTLYSQGKYWDAYFLFAQIQNDYPDFFKGDWVSYYAASCQENMDMREIALHSFEAVKLEFPQSPVVAYTELGTMRINYRDDDYHAVARQFEALSVAGIPDSVKYSAAYLMGETYLHQKEYQRAINLFRVVPFDHQDYIFAQHSAAIALLSIDSIVAAETCLQNCLGAVSQTDAQKEIVNRTNLYLGYMLYEGLIEEPQPLSKAVTLLRKIPVKSIYYEDALMLLGWTAIKARQTNDAIAAGIALQNSKNQTFAFEGCLITVYGYVMQNKFNEAKALIVPAQAKIASLTAPSEDSLSGEKQQYISTRTAYNFLAEKVAECAQKQQAGAALSENNALHEQQRTIKSNIDASLAVFDAFKKNMFLTRNLAELKQDFNYILAYTSQKAAGTDIQKEHNKTLEKEKKTDEKIEKLKKQLEEIENKKK